MINVDPIRDSFHITGYPEGVNPTTAYQLRIHYIFHALAVPVQDGNCFLYGLDEKLKADHFDEIKAELKRMSFNAVSWHGLGGEVRWQLL